MFSENSKIITRLDSFSKPIYFLLICLLDECILKFANLQYFPLTPFVTTYRVTDEASIAKTAA